MMVTTMNDGNGSGERLRAYIERVESLTTEITLLKDDVKEVFAEAKAVGFDQKVMKQMIKERATDPGVRLAWQDLCDQYRAALGMLEGTPLGDAARERFEALRRGPARKPASAPARPRHDA